MLRIRSDNLERVGHFAYRDLVRDRVRGPQVVYRTIDILLGRVEGLPCEWSGLVAMADLQGAAGTLSEPELPGLEACRHLDALAAAGAIPPLDEMLALLAGDFFAHLTLHKRGGGGDATPVWEAVASRFGTVLGVAGNHDRFESVQGAMSPDVAASELLAHLPNAALVDADVHEARMVKVGAVCGVIGESHRPFRRSEAEFLAALERVHAKRPDVMVLHQGPSPEDHHRASLRLRQACIRHGPRLTIYGHDKVAASARFEEFDSGAQFLNVCERVVVLVS